MKTAKNRYDINKGKRAEFRGMTGIICGYNEPLKLLIMIVDGEQPLGKTKRKGIIERDKGKVFKTKKSRGYLYVTEDDIIKTKENEKCNSILR